MNESITKLGIKTVMHRIPPTVPNWNKQPRDLELRKDRGWLSERSLFHLFSLFRLGSKSEDVNFWHESSDSTQTCLRIIEILSRRVWCNPWGEEELHLAPNRTSSRCHAAALSVADSRGDGNPRLQGRATTKVHVYEAEDGSNRKLKIDCHGNVWKRPWWMPTILHSE